MKTKLTWLALAAALSLAPTPARSEADVVASYVRDGYKYTCIMMDKVRHCGNWNVASRG